MARILVGIATVTPDQRFLESLPIFSQEVVEQGLAKLDFMWVWNKPLVEAQNAFAERVLAWEYDYLLTLEDDHWGFNAAMLRDCLRLDTHVAAISYRSRHFPFEMIPMKYMRKDKNGAKLYNGMKETKGIHEGDLCGFGFTLIKDEVFKILERPFFRLNIEAHKGVGPRATDIDFCTRLEEKGIKPIGIFDHRLPHREITDETYQEMLVTGVIAKHSMFTRMKSIMNDSKKEKISNVP